MIFSWLAKLFHLIFIRHLAVTGIEQVPSHKKIVFVTLRSHSFFDQLLLAPYGPNNIWSYQSVETYHKEDDAIIVPVAINYLSQKFGRFDAWLRFALPLPTDSSPEQIDKAVAEINQLFQWKQQFERLYWATELLITEEKAPLPLGQEENTEQIPFNLMHQLYDGYAALIQTEQEKVTQLSDEIANYRQELYQLAIRPDELYLNTDTPRALFFLVRELELLLIGFPWALLGILFHFLPYQISKKLTNLSLWDEENWRNFLFVWLAVYLVELLLAIIFLPSLYSILFFVLFLYSALIFPLYWDRTAAIWRRSRTFFYFWRNPEEQQRLIIKGRKIIKAIYAFDQRPVSK